MRSVLTNASPKECELIASGKQTILVRKTQPKIETPFKCYIYATKPKKWFSCGGHIRTSDECLWLADGKVKMCDGLEFWSDGYNDYQRINGKVIGEFVCDKIYAVKYSRGGFMIDNDIALTNRTARESCLQFADLKAYFGKKDGYAWHISDLKIYDKPKELGEFRKCDIYCGDCKHIVLPTDRLPLSDCDRRCDKFNKDLLFYDSFNCCEECLELNTIIRPPMSWCYVEE